MLQYLTPIVDHFFYVVFPLCSVAQRPIQADPPVEETDGIPGDQTQLQLVREHEFDDSVNHETNRRTVFASMAFQDRATHQAKRITRCATLFLPHIVRIAPAVLYAGKECGQPSPILGS